MRVALACSIADVAGTPTLVWHTGQIASLTDVGVGQIQLNLTPSQGIDPGRCVWLATPRGTAVAGQQRTIGVNQIDADTIALTTLIEQANPNPSILADFNWDVVCVAFDYGPEADARLYGVARIMLDQADFSIAAADGAMQSGLIDSLTTVGAGHCRINLQAAMGADANDTAVIVCPKASEMQQGQGRTCHVVPVNDVTWDVMLLEEAKPAASALTSFPFTIMWVSRSAPPLPKVGYQSQQTADLYNAGIGGGAGAAILQHTGHWASIQRDALGTYQTNFQASMGLGPLAQSVMFCANPAAAVAGAMRYIHHWGGTLPTTQRLFTVMDEQAGLASAATDANVAVVGVQVFNP